MNKNSNHREGQSDLNQRSTQQPHNAQATARAGQQGMDRSETPSGQGQSKIEAPMTGKKICAHAGACDCSTDMAIHASEEHAPRFNRHH